MSETIGQQLSSARLARNLSIDQVAKATSMRVHAILALEADDFDSFPSTTQARGFLKIYAEFLGMSLPDMFARQRMASQVPPPVSDESESWEEISQPSSIEMERASPKKWGFPKKKKVDPVIFKVSDQSALEEPLASHDEVSNMEEEIITISPGEASGPQDFQPTAESRAGESGISASQQIFTAIGEELRQRRQVLSISLDEIEKHIHLRRQHLESLESGHISDLPSPVQARGMLHNYARFLDLDVDAIMLKYADGLQTQRVEIQIATTAQAEKKHRSKFNIKIPASIRRFLTMETLIGLGILISLVIFATWGTGYLIRQNAAVTPVSTAPSISEILLSSTLSGEATSTSEAAQVTLTLSPDIILTPAFTLPAGGPVQIVLVSTRSVYLKVIVDDVVKFTGRTEPGLVYIYNATTQIEVVTGDGSAVSVIYNQVDLGPMGARGELIDRIYTTTAILLPSPTSTPTATITLTPTITPRPSATPRYSPTTLER